MDWALSASVDPVSANMSLTYYTILEQLGHGSEAAQEVIAITKSKTMNYHQR
jgi:hypothetical protein